MSTHTNIQTIMQNGKPAFVVIPFAEYVRLFPEAPRIPEGDAIPHEVVGLTIKKGYTLVHAWREYLRLTQTEVAERMGITHLNSTTGKDTRNTGCNGNIRVLYSKITRLIRTSPCPLLHSGE
jgi:hypothetical protein